MSRFFCHKCNIEIYCLLPDYTCPYCSSGFIEELENGNDSGSSMDVSTEEQPEGDSATLYNRLENDSDLMDMLLLGLPVSRSSPSSTNNRWTAPGTRRRAHEHGHSEPRRSGSNRGTEQSIPVPIENLIQEFILNLSGVGLGLPMTQGGPVLFLGNPGDYVWGRDGLDAIGTQLLDQMDGTGPPPLPRKQIDEIPTTTVAQCHVDCKLQCSVCWEDFMLSEPVRQLPCQHLYHAPCIVPWLELHGTCPICRQNLGDQSAAEANQDTLGPSLAALFRAANESVSSRTSTSSTTAESNTSNDSHEI